MPSETAQIDSTIEIVTPENIAFHYRAAGPFLRLPAYAVDVLLRIVLFVAAAWGVGVLAMHLGPVLGTLVSQLFGPLLLIWWFVLEWFYGGIFETYMNGQTPGKWLLGVRVLTVDGQPINGLQAVTRNLLRLVDMSPLLSLEVFQFVPIYLLPTFVTGLVATSLNRRYQRLGDLVCGTMVVIEERRLAAGVARLEDPRAAQLAAYVPANFRVSLSLARALAAYVDRRRYFSPTRRREVAHHLAEPLLRLFRLPSDTSYDLLLCALYHRTFIADPGEQERRWAGSGQSLFTGGRAAKSGGEAAPQASEGG